MEATSSQITSLMIVFSTVYSDTDVRGIHRNVSIWWRHHVWTGTFCVIFLLPYFTGYLHHPGINLLQYIPRNMHTVFALLCFVVVIHWLIFSYPSGLLHWHCGNLTIAPVPAKQPRWIWINISCEFIMNDCITTTKQSTTKPCAYFFGYTVLYTTRLSSNGLSYIRKTITRTEDDSVHGRMVTPLLMYQHLEWIPSIIRPQWASCIVLDHR